MRFLINIIFLYLALLPNSFGNDYVANILHIKGEVSLSVLNGPYGDAKRGDLLSEGNKLRTGESSLAIVRFPDKSVMRVGPNSVIEIEEIVERVEGKSIGKSSIMLETGRALINVINKSKAPVFDVKTRYAAIGVRGTNFLTVVDPESSDVDIAVDKGEVEIRSKSNQGHADAIDAGEGITLEKGDIFTQPKSYDWIKKVNFNAEDKRVSPDYFKSFEELRKLEFRKKREAWKRNAKEWMSKQRSWSQRKNEYLNRVKSLKESRKRFLEKKKNFLRNKKKLDIKRNKHFKSLKKIQADIKDLSKDKKKWKKAVADYRKSGIKNKQTLDKLKSERLSLNKRTKSLKSKFKKERGVASVISDNQSQILDQIKQYSKKIDKKKVTKKVRKKVNRKIERKLKDSMSKKIDKGLKGFFK